MASTVARINEKVDPGPCSQEIKAVVSPKQTCDLFAISFNICDNYGVNCQFKHANRTSLE